MRIEESIIHYTRQGIRELYGAELPEGAVQVQETLRDLNGDITLVVFPLVRYSKKKPEDTAVELGQFLQRHLEAIAGFEVIKGFLNLSLKPGFWIEHFNGIRGLKPYGHKTPDDHHGRVVVEYSSPNTNKPLHLGHIRNNLLGFAVSSILEANGMHVTKVNLVNDRGIHICKSMLAWLRWGEDMTPDQAGVKGDKLVGEYYVRFDKEYKKEIASRLEQGFGEEEAASGAPLILEAQEMLRKWEQGDPEVMHLWETMNGWVYEGFDETYKKLGVGFDRIYYESQTYRLGKEIVMQALSDGVLFRKADGSVWADLTGDGLDQKLLLRSDGTSVYMTQDLGTAHQRFEEYGFDKHIYVVGNEQDYHFKVLALILGKMGYEWSNRLFHLSYGMVELPQGKMKSREGTVVDADDLIEGMIEAAAKVSDQLGKLDQFPAEERETIYYRIAMGALKYFILKVDPQKTMLFNPEESIDFNGNTGPFIQYSYVRVRSVQRKAAETGENSVKWDGSPFQPHESEINLLKRIYKYPVILRDAGQTLSPALVANYFYELVREFNQFYQQCPILKETDPVRKSFRLELSGFVADHIQSGMRLLGIEMPDRM